MLSQYFRRYVLPIAAVAIISACTWRLVVPRPQAPVPLGAISDSRPAPEFELYDQNSKAVRLKSYLHRHPIVLVFFEPSGGANKDPFLAALAAEQDLLSRRQVVVFGLSTSLPQENRKRFGDDYPFPLLSLVSPLPAQSPLRFWRCVHDDPDGGITIRPAAFLIDHTGQVAWNAPGPIPVESPDALLQLLR